MGKKTNEIRRSMLCKLLLVRHGQTTFNKEGRFYGRIDAPLTEVGKAQAVTLRRRLVKWQIDAAMSSPLSRALHTGEIALANHELTIETDELLVEMDHGRWEGLLFAEARKLDPEAWELWRAGKLENPHGGETLPDVFKRAEQWLEKVKATYNQGETIVVFAHGGLLQALTCVLMGTPPRPLWQYRYGNCAIAEIEVYPLGGVLVSLG